MIKKNFNLNLKEYNEFSKKVMIKTKLKIFIVMGLIVLVGASAVSYKEGFINAITTGVSLFVAYMLIVFLGMFGFAPLFAKKAYKKNNISQINFSYEILETGIKQGKNVFLYENFTMFREGKYSYFLYLQNKEIVLIPKRILTNDEKESLIKIVTKKINNVKLKKANKQ